MGSPLGSTLANLFLTYYEDTWLNNCLIWFWLRYYCRYVDDFFLMFERKDHLKKFLRYMNSHHTNIQLTCKEEPNNKISFLGAFITRINNKLVTSLY